MKSSFFHNVIVGALVAHLTLALAQSYPAKPITLVVGYPPGGSVDLVARTLAPELGRRLGQAIVIDNAASASGTIGTQKVVNAAADGYTLLLGSGSKISIVRLTNPAVRYDGARFVATGFDRHATDGAGGQGNHRSQNH